MNKGLNLRQYIVKYVSEFLSAEESNKKWEEGNQKLKPFNSHTS